MSMSTHLVGFRPADEKYRKMFAALTACREAGLKPPPEVTEFFGGEPEEADQAGARVELPFQYNDRPPAGVRSWSTESGAGVQVDIRELDPSIKILRFYNSW